MSPQLLLAYAAPYRSSLALALLLMLASTSVTLAIPWLGGQYAAYILSESRFPPLVILGALLALFAVQALLNFSNSWVTGRTGANILADLRLRIYDHLQALPLSFHHDRARGDVMALITYEVAQLANFITGTLLSLIPLLLTVAGAIVLMLRIDPALAGLVAVLVPVFYLVLKILGRRLQPLSQRLQATKAAALGIANENLAKLLTIKTFTREAYESARYATEIGRARELSIEEIRVYAQLQPAIQFCAAAAAVLLLWLATARIASAQMQPADLVSLLLYAALLTRPVAELAGVYGQVQMARGTLQRLQSVLTERTESLLNVGRTLDKVVGDVEFRDVRFAYKGRTPTLAGLNLHIRAGETVAITGTNGAGKSTLAHLLLRLYEPDAGIVLVDGVDIATASLHSVRAQIGVVPQHVMLFNATVGDNIAYGRAGAAASAIEQAARQAQVHEFIVGLPQGYDTVIGDDGIKLSGGQRQRVALARALLKNPTILILDEPTAMFDPQSEKSFIEDCYEMLSQRTVLLITHRPASLAMADRIVLINAGRAEELHRPEAAARAQELEA